MNIKFFTSHAESLAPLLVDFRIKMNNQILFQKNVNLQNKIKVIDATFDLVTFDQHTITAEISTNNFNIRTHGVQIENIILDNFYSLPKITYSAVQQFDDEHLIYANKNKIFLDLTTNDNSFLDFTGTLLYQFTWPFFKNMCYD